MRTGYRGVHPRVPLAMLLLLLPVLAQPTNAGEEARGKRLYLLCASCHEVRSDGPELAGPHLQGVVGREAGAVKDYAYSETVAQSGIRWTRETLDRWLQNPAAYLPGNKMAFLGIQEPAARAALIDYLETLGTAP